MSTMMGIGYVANALVNLHNAKEGRRLHEIARKEANERYELEREINRERFERDFSFREQQFLYSQDQHREAVSSRLEERMKDFLRQDKRDKEFRAHSLLGKSFHASVDAFYVDDPHAFFLSGMKSLRALIQKPSRTSEEFHTHIERAVNSAIKKYSLYGKDYPLSLATGVWNENAPSGNYAARELFSWDSQIPGLILRMQRTLDGKHFALEADVWGFPLDGKLYHENINLGEVSDDPDEIAQILSLTTLAMADFYFLSVYGKMPLLPFVLPEYAQNNERSLDACINQIVAGYQLIVNEVLKEDTKIGLHAALNLAEAFIAFPDKKFAVKQIKEIEHIARKILPEWKQLEDALCDLYVQAKVPEEVIRLSAGLEEQRSQKLLPKVTEPPENLLDKYL